MRKKELPCLILSSLSPRSPFVPSSSLILCSRSYFSSVCPPSSHFPWQCLNAASALCPLWDFSSYLKVIRYEGRPGRSSTALILHRWTAGLTWWDGHKQSIYKTEQIFYFIFWKENMALNMVSFETKKQKNMVCATVCWIHETIQIQYI